MHLFYIIKNVNLKLKKEKVINPLDLNCVYIENVKIHNFIYLNVSM